jgi:SAM-dependent methyltransferase
VSTDPEAYRAASLEQWAGSAAGWGARAAQLQEVLAPVSVWMVEAVNPQPGQTVLELAAGPGETGFLAAELIHPGGTLICSDFAEPMLDVARTRVQELGLDNVEFRRLDAESLDLDAASVDSVLCRYGYMLMADSPAALRETRRVLRPGGRMALAAWAPAEENPWASIAGQVVRTRLGAPEPDPAAPGMFAFGPPGRLAGLLADAGFTDARVEEHDLTFAYPSFAEWWEITHDVSKPLADLVDAMEPADREATLEAVHEAFAPYTGPSGELAFPARTLLASAAA